MTGSDKIDSLAEIDHFEPRNPVTILVPGFINLHCHLAYSKIKLESQALFPWLKELMKNTFSAANYSSRSNVLDGIDDLLKFGTTFVVDNCFSLEESYEAIAQKQIKALIGLEVLALIQLRLRKYSMKKSKS